MAKKTEKATLFLTPFYVSDKSLNRSWAILSSEKKVEVLNPQLKSWILSIYTATTIFRFRSFWWREKLKLPMALPSQSIGRRKCHLFDEEICGHFCYQKKCDMRMMSCIWFWPSELKKQFYSLPHSKFQTEVWFVFEAMWALKKGLKVLTRNSKVRFWIFMLLQHWNPIFWDTFFELLHVICVWKTTLLVKHKYLRYTTQQVFCLESPEKNERFYQHRGSPGSFSIVSGTGRRNLAKCPICAYW